MRVLAVFFLIFFAALGAKASTCAVELTSIDKMDSAMRDWLTASVERQVKMMNFTKVLLDFDLSGPEAAKKYLEHFRTYEKSQRVIESDRALLEILVLISAQCSNK